MTERLQWFVVPAHRGSVTDLAERLHAVGVRPGSCRGTAYYFVDPELDQVVKWIGEVELATDGLISTHPCLGATERDLEGLLLAAEDSFRHKPSGGTGWTYHRSARSGSWWSTRIFVQADDDDPVARCIARAQRSIVPAPGWSPAGQ